MRALITRVNAARRAHPALQTNERLLFHPVDNPNLLVYSKNTADQRDVILCVVNFDYHATQSGTIALDLAALGMRRDAPYRAVDLLDDQTYTWSGDTPGSSSTPPSAPPTCCGCDAARPWRRCLP